MRASSSAPKSESSTSSSHCRTCRSKIIAVTTRALRNGSRQQKLLAGPARELKYLLRAYDSKGNFDETDARPLWLYREPSLWKDVATSDEAVAARAAGRLRRERPGAPADSARQRHGEGAGQRHTGGPHGLGGGPPGTGRPAGQLRRGGDSSDGAHTVEVAVLDDAGNGSLYLRDLEFKRTDLFYVGMADVTVSQNQRERAIDLLQGENAPQPYDSSLDGRLAFYVNGKVSDHWRLTASADTREGPVKDLFSNFLSKSPDSLFRRIDPDYHYPTFGDDGVVTEMAPTMGKFYVKASHGESYGMWGNFNVGYMDNELAHVDRGLYGGNAHYRVRTPRPASASDE